MRYFFALSTLCLLPLFVQAQFKPVAKQELTIIVTDGTDEGKRSELVKKQKQQAKGAGAGATKSDIPSSYDSFLSPIRPLGMTDAIQAAAFIERPLYGRPGFLLIFCVNDSIGDEQGEHEANGQTYKGVYRLIRQKFTPEEPIPEGMAAYKLGGTLFILGVS